MRELIGVIASLVAGWLRRRRPKAGRRKGTPDSKRRMCVARCGLIASLALAQPAQAVPSRPTLKADSVAVTATARGLKVGAGLRIEGLSVDAGSPESVLELNRVDVFTEDAEILAYSEQGTVRLPVPKDIHLRGFVEADPSSTAVLTVSPSGRIRGIIRSAKGVWAVGTKRERMVMRQAKPKKEHPDHKFECGTEDPSEEEEASIQADADAAEEMLARAAALPVGYTARVAVETDYEFLWLPAFEGNTAAASRYVGDLFAYVSAIYEAEIGTSLKVSSLHLRTSPNDPWTATTLSTAIYELKTYWKANYPNVARSTTHMLSGKRLGGGVAYNSGLCSNESGYAVSGELDGDFTPRNPGVVWDSVVVAHELGHNFGSPHTHCYIGIGGNNEPVDRCYGKEPSTSTRTCYSGAASLPCSTPGAGCGTLMSYCDGFSGGLRNVSMTFGLNHSYGTAPDRVPVRMASYVAARAASFPGCLSLLPSTPTGVAATDGAHIDKVRLSWTQTTGVNSYRVLRSVSNSAAGATVIGNTAALTYDDTTATPGTTYWYWVVGIGATAESAPSNSDSGYRRVLASPTVATGAASGVGADSAKLQAQVNPNGLATSVHFEWGTTTAYGKLTTSQALGAGTATLPVAATLAGLTPGTTYNYRIVATNSAGTSRGANKTWTTSAGVCVVGTVSSGTTISDSLSAGGCRSASRGSSYYADRFKFDGVAGEHVAIRMSSTAFDTYLYLTSKGTLIAADDGGGGATSSRIPMGTASFVLPWTGSFTIEATSNEKNVSGKYTLSIVRWATTPAPNVVVGGVTGIGTTKATLEGSVNPKGLATVVYLDWGTTIDCGNIQILGKYSGASAIPVKVTLSALSPNTTYHYRILASSSAGFAFGSDMAWKTLAAP